MRKRAPIRLWLQDDVPTAVRVFWRRRVHDPIWALRHRTVDRYNVVNLTSLKPGYYEIDTRMLHAAFDLLVEYVEIGLAYKNYTWWEARTRPWVKKLSKKIPRRMRARLHRKLRPLYSRENRIAAGLAHLDWEISDTTGLQQSNAVAIKDMYLWWTVERPDRDDPWGDDRLWAGLREEKLDFFDSLSNPSKSGRRDAGRLAEASSEFYHEQDQAMLRRLIEIRRGLWT